jgi:hypothetical protein
VESVAKAFCATNCEANHIRQNKNYKDVYKIGFGIGA